jgi:putative two-component system response regulator
MEFAAFIGLPEEERHLLFKAGILHDIGKMGIDDYILHKTGLLTEEEFKLVKDHVLIGEHICMPLHSARKVLPVIRHHHERWDGTGFPDGLKGMEIPFFARITAITDTFDAMVSVRPYRDPFTVEAAVNRMENEKYMGQWDPELLDKFIEMMKHQNGGSI